MPLPLWFLFFLLFRESRSKPGVSWIGSGSGSGGGEILLGRLFRKETTVWFYIIRTEGGWCPLSEPEDVGETGQSEPVFWNDSGDR